MVRVDWAGCGRIEPVALRPASPEMAGEVFLDKQFEKLKDDDIIVSRDWSHHQFILRFDETYPEELRDYGVCAALPARLARF